jgi:hypothetical protein
VSGLASPEPYSYPGSGTTLRVVERYTRTDATTIQYRATIEDPEVYTSPYTVTYDFARDDGFFMPQYQCHENNQLNAMIAAARADEATATDNAHEVLDEWHKQFGKLKADWAQRSGAGSVAK